MRELKPFLDNTFIYRLSEISLDQMTNFHKDEYGVYGIFCETEEKIYVGSSTNKKRRLREHFVNLKSNKELQKAFKKYSHSAFSVILFEKRGLRVDLTDVLYDSLIKKETYLLQNIDSTILYNDLKRMPSITSYGYKHTKEFLKRLSEQRKGHLNPFYGRRHSDTWKKEHSKRVKGQIIESIRKPVKVLNKEGNLLYEFPGVKETEKSLQICHKTLKHYAISGKPFTRKNT